ncbi:helix-turn-helix domain-containing protein [Subtercola boreus]|nr:helix-turn-helix transcriptional regulator [Subtercola boreus]
MGAAALFLKASRESSGLTQQVVALRAQTSTPALSHIENSKRDPSAAKLDTLLRATGNRLGVVPTNRSGSLEAGAAIHDELAIGDEKSAFRSFLQFSDNLAAETGVVRVVLAANEPPSTGSLLWDAALAAVSEYWLNRGHLPVPDWTTQADRTLAHRTVLSGDRYTRSIDQHDVPREFAARNVAVDRSVLASV